MDMIRVNKVPLLVVITNLKIFWYEQRIDEKAEAEELNIQDLDHKTREEILKAKVVSLELAENFVGILSAIGNVKKLSKKNSVLLGPYLSN